MTLTYHDGRHFIIRDLSVKSGPPRKKILRDWAEHLGVEAIRYKILGMTALAKFKSNERFYIADFSNSLPAELLPREGFLEMVDPFGQTVLWAHHRRTNALSRTK